MRHTIFIGLILLTSSAGIRANDIDYNRDIRPILSDRCFYCHGPDEGHREADLRLDLAESAHESVITARKPDDSELIARITSDDADSRMPPVDSGKSLSKAEIELLRRWIEQGAKYEGHWSFIAPSRPQLPRVKDTEWVRNAIDRFVLARLDAEGLQPSPAADKATLLRRVSLDLTGLPPTPAEVDAFVNDTSPRAYEDVVDRLLKSDRYGERMALDWLNAARYADTNGYQVDRERQMWIWRDWVVRAFNENKPFDEFTIEQIAGDMLPDATIDQKIASGFNRNHRINGEGGVIPEEYRVEYVIDRVETTGTVWLGLTLGCARCHSHKFDPVSHHEFYQLFSYFNNVPENGRDGLKGNAAPMLTVPIPDMQPVVAEAANRVRDIRKRLTEDSADFRADLERWSTNTIAALAAGKVETIWHAADVTDAESTGNIRLERQDDGSLLATGANPSNPVYTLTIAPGEREITTIRLETLTHPNMTKNGLARSVNGNFVLTEFEVLQQRPDMNEPELLKIASAQSGYSQQNYPITNAIDGQANTGWAILGRKQVADTPAMFVLASPLQTDGDTRLIIRLRHDSQYGQHAIGRLRISLTSSTRPALGETGSLPPEIVAILQLSADERSEQQQRELADFYRDLSPVYGTLRQQLASAEKALKAAKGKSTTTVMVMQEMEDRRPTFLLNRGQYDQPGEAVDPGIPVSLGALPDGVTNDRLGLAKWLVDASNPLTARVTMNRFWQSYFGTGLVKSVDDFGAQGEFPSHPELLDWLATEFIRSGWDVKAMQKLIVTSATYQQATAASPELRERDPDNRLLARGPRNRLSGPVIRDQALAVSGLLREKTGGPSVKPYQPAGIWADVSGKKGLSYPQGQGDDLYRRSMYTFWKRTAAPPTMIIFDAGGRERCDVAVRATNTPLQALASLNDIQFVEAARFLAERMMREGGDSPAERLTYGWRLALSRHPDTTEQRQLVASYEHYLAQFQSDSKKTEALLAIGDKPRDASLNAAEQAALTTVANVILSLDEFVTRE